MIKIKKIFRNILAIIFFILAIIGGLIPILQGWMFFLVGYILLDFKKKEEYEEKFLVFISKNKIGEKVADFWRKIKAKNTKSIEDGKNESVKSLLHEIREDNKTCEKLK